MRQRVKIQPFSRKAFFKRLPLYFLVYSLRYRPRDETRKKIEKFGKKAVPPLVEALYGKNKPGFVKEVCLLLGRITKKPFGNHPEAWKKWWEEKGKKLFSRKD